MASIKLRGSTILEDFGRPYIVAEVNTSHFGDINIAKKMIETIKNAGCDCVKFQSWTTETLYSTSYYKENPIAKRFVDRLSFSRDELKELSSYSKRIGIDFCSTPYSHKEVDFLVSEQNVPYIKVASMDLNNYRFLSYIASTGTPIVLSTGMSEMDEIKKAVKTIEAEGNQNICILHCVSIYPPELSTINLKNIIGLRDAFPNYPIGYSDHSGGIEIASASVVFGACMIEKHFTLDKKKIGMDNQMALEPDEMELLVKNCQNVQKSLGNAQRVVLPAEIEQRNVMRRSIVSKKDLKAGNKIKLDDLDAKRPGTGFPPQMIHELVGKTLANDVKCDMLLNEDDILNN
jgi:sialic acid synthase SpsE